MSEAAEHSMDARMLPEDVTIPELAKGDEILFTTARRRVHAVRLASGWTHVSTSERGNVYVTVIGYRIHQEEPRSSFGNKRYFTIRADGMRKF